MAAALGSLVVSLGLDAAEFVDGLTKSEYQARKFVRDLTGATTRAIGTFAAIGTAAAGALAALGAAAETIAIYQDLGDVMGTTAENAAALQLAADISSTSLDTVAAASVKLTSALSKTDDEGKGAGAALKIIGLELKAFKELDPVTQFEQVAFALAGIEEGTKRTAIATALYGKSGAQLIPFLNDLAETGGRQVRLTQEQIRAADEYAKAYARVKSELSAVAQVAIAESIPAATALATELSAVAKAIFGINEEGGRLQASNAVREFASDAAVAIAVVVEGAIGAAKAIRAIGGSFQAVGADIGQAASVARALANFGPGQGIEETGRLINEASAKRDAVVREANQRYIDLWNYDGTRISDAIRQALSAEQRTLNRVQSDPRELARRGRGPATLRQIDISGLANGTSTAQAKAADEAQRYLEGLQKQLQATQDLSVAETVLADIRAGRLGKVSADQQQALLGVAQQIDAAKRLQSQLQAEAQQERDLAEQRRKLADEGRAVFEATRSPLEKLNTEYARLDRLLAEGAITWDTYARAVLDAAEASEKAAEKASATADDFTKRAAQNFQDFLGQGLYDLLSGNFKSIEQGFIQMVNRMIAEAAAADLARYLLGDLVKDGKGEGLLGGVLKSVLGAMGIGGRANGGQVLGGGMYRVAENRPEMLDVNGQQFLLMGNQRGRIDPNPRIGGRGGVSVTNNFTVTGAVDRRTQRQTATMAGQAVQAALARNG